MTGVSVACLSPIKPSGRLLTHAELCVCLAVIHFPLSYVPSFCFYVTALSFIGPAGQLDSSVCRTKETKWDRGRAVMSNSSYSVTYRPAAVWGSLLETMEGFERSGVL